MTVILLHTSGKGLVLSVTTVASLFLLPAPVSDETGAGAIVVVAVVVGVVVGVVDGTVVDGVDTVVLVLVGVGVTVVVVVDAVDVLVLGEGVEAVVDADDAVVAGVVEPGVYECCLLSGKQDAGSLLSLYCSQSSGLSTPQHFSCK